jgi:hypothetical protein
MSVYNPLPVATLLNLFNLKEESDDSHFIKSDYCHECDGEGFVSYRVDLFDDWTIEKEQCPECEHLHKQEIYADRMHDLAKGN